MTREEIAAKLQERIFHKKQTEVVWGDLVSVVASAPAADKTLILSAANRSDYVAVGDVLMKLIRAKLYGDAGVEVTTILTDDSLNLTELERIL